MKKWLACLKDQRGTAFPLVIAVTLACLLILCGIMEFFRLSLIASGVKEALQDAVVVVVNDNYANVYHGVREGYSGGYYTEGYGFEEAVDTGDIYYHLDETLGTRREGGNRVKSPGWMLQSAMRHWHPPTLQMPSGLKQMPWSGWRFRYGLQGRHFLR